MRSGFIREAGKTIESNMEKLEMGEKTLENVIEGAGVLVLNGLENGIFRLGKVIKKIDALEKNVSDIEDGISCMKDVAILMHVANPDLTYGIWENPEDGRMDERMDELLASLNHLHKILNSVIAHEGRLAKDLMQKLHDSYSDAFTDFMTELDNDRKE